MTVVIAYLGSKRNGMLAADSLLSYDEPPIQTTDAVPKILKRERFLVGFAGDCVSFGTLGWQMSKEWSQLATAQSAEEEFDVLQANFVPELRRKIRKDDENLTFKEDSVLLVSKFSIYELYNDISIAKHRSFAAIGSGAPIALGSLFASQASKMPAAKAVALALRATETYCPDVRGPFWQLKLTDEKVSRAET